MPAHELESLFAHEGEFELESEWEAAHEGGLHEGSHEAGLHEFEFEGLHEGGLHEAEADRFLGQLVGLARRGLQSPALRRIALNAARSALGALGESGAHEMEGEFEWEMESELNPIRRIYPDAMMEHLAHMAAEAESEQEAGEAFLPLIPLVASKLLPLAAKAIPMAAKALPKIASSVMRSTPQLTRGVTNITRTLYRNPQTRQLVRAVPTIARRTVNSIAQQAAGGRTVTPQAALRMLARQSAQVLGNPQRAALAMRRARALDRQLHRSPIGAALGSAGAVRAGCGCASACPTCGR
jgi:hypothetical protein